MRAIRIFSLCLVFILTHSSCVNYYYVVRHADKGAQANDDTQTPLSRPGNERAIVLCDTLRDKNIKRIFESQYLRTQQTANPTQALLGITPTPYTHTNPAETGASNLVAQLRGITQNVLVVGHSDNIPLIIQQMTGETVTITHDDFDNFFVIKRVRDIASNHYTLYRGTYGPPTQ